MWVSQTIGVKTMLKTKKLCINVQDNKKRHKKIHVRVKKEDLPLLRLALSDSTSVISFWEE